MNRYATILVTVIMGLLANSANATPILCSADGTKNHMLVDDSLVSACVASGIGNINGNTTTDDFLTSGGTAAGYVYAGDGAFTQDGSMGTFTVAAGVEAIGFKFGTGNKPDEWFIYDLVDGVTTGTWEFINVFSRGGGLSHIVEYCNGDCATSPPCSGDCGAVPEPGIAALLGIGLLGLVAVRRKKTV
jgi:hypothetical protein